MKFHIINLKNYPEIHRINIKISNLIENNIKNNNEIINKILFSFNYGCFENDKEILFYLNNKNHDSIIFESQLNQAFSYFIKNCFNISKLNYRIGYELLLIYQEIIVSTKNNSEDIYDLFYLMDFPCTNKGLILFNEIINFSEKLKDMFFNRKVSIKEAYLFHKTFLNNYDKFLLILPENLSFTQVNMILRNISEYSKKENITIIQIIKLFKSIKKENMLDASKKLKYPKYSVYKSIMIDYINRLKLPNGVKVNFDETFEKEDYILELKFNNINSLLKKINHIKKNIDDLSQNKNTKDLFIHSNLFEYDGGKYS